MDKFVLYAPEDRWHSAVCFSEAEVLKCLSNVKFGLGQFPTIERFGDADMGRDMTEHFRDRFYTSLDVCACGNACETCMYPRCQLADDYAHADHFKRVYGARL